MHVREHPSGRVIVTPVEFANLSVDAEDEATAMRLATDRVSTQLRKLSGSYRARLAEPVDGELDSVSVQLPKVKGTEALRVNVALVVTVRATHTGTIFLVAAPEVPHVRLAGRERDEVVTRARKAIRQTFQHWDLEADRTGRDAGPLDGEPYALRIAGPASVALLRHEAGLHRRRLPNGTKLLARVTVTVAGAEPEPPRDEDAATIVRGYSQGRHVFVKDTRTGQKTSDVDGVLERGLIDDFLVAEVRENAGQARATT
jgi:hypothetical protein